MDNNRSRIAVVASLVLSASGLIGIAVSEGWEPVARPPVQGDVPTGGFGSTRAESGPMKAGERIVRRCAPVPMYQHEFDAAVSLAYNIGGKAFCGSTVARRFNAGDYAGACDAFLMWDKFQGRALRGLTLRRERERAMCLGETP